MKLLLVALSLVAAVVAAPTEPESFSPLDYTAFDYHNRFGIAEAARILASEKSSDFDGSRIAGGNRAQLGQHPHMGGLMVATPRGTSVCNCGLLSNTRFSTSAHCWWDGATQATQMTVVLGSINFSSGGLRINTNNVEVHGSWNPRLVRDDVAIGIISWVNFGSYIRSIAMATGSNSFAGSIATAVGFGRKGDNVGIPSNQPLSYVKLEIITNAVCRRSFNVVVDSTLCTSGAGGRSTCPGDSGCPLTVGNKMVGIYSFGASAGCTRGFPAGFARVTYYASWIAARM